MNILDITSEYLDIKTEYFKPIFNEIENGILLIIHLFRYNF